MWPWATLLLSLTALSAAAGYTVDCDSSLADCEKALRDLKEISSQMVSTVMATDSSSNGTTVETSRTTTKPTTARFQDSLTTLDVFTDPNSTKDFNFAEWAHVFDDSSRELDSKPKVSSKKTDSGETSINESSFEKRARALNLTLDELRTFANSIHGHSNASQNGRSLTTDLSDVSLDGDENTTEYPMELQLDGGRILNKPIQAGMYSSNAEDSFQPSFSFVNGNSDSLSCTEDGITYRMGQKFRKACEEQCECVENGLQCSPICKHPYFRTGRRLPDPLCSEKPVDECCALLVCASDDSDRKMPGFASCKFGNATYAVGAKWNVGCEEVCVCESSAMVNCSQRCPELPAREHCVNVPDPSDQCCQLQLCDVSQDVHEESMKEMISEERNRIDNRNISMAQDRADPLVNELTSFEGRDSNVKGLNMEPIRSVNVLANNSVQINIFRANTSDNPIHLQVSKMGDNKWHDILLKEYNLLLNMEPGNYKIKSLETGTPFNFTIPSKAAEVDSDGLGPVVAGCSYEGKVFAIGEEYHKGCLELCECIGPNESECNRIQCPSTVGLDVLEPSCVSWAPDPPDFQPIAPHCCPRTMRCLSNGSCQYEGHTIPNWSEVPLGLSGCERRCFCDTGIIDCQPNCSPLPALPPAHLRCQLGQRPALVESLVPGDDCCKQWGCIAISKGRPPSTVWQESAVLTPNHTYFHKTMIHVNHVTATPLPSTMFNNFTRYPPSLENITHPNDMLLVYPKSTKNVLQNRTSNPGAGSNTYTPKIYMNTNQKSYSYPGPFADPFQISADKYNKEQLIFDTASVKGQKYGTENSNNKFVKRPTEKFIRKLSLTSPVTIHKPTTERPFYLKHLKAERKLSLNSPLPKVPLFTPLPNNVTNNQTVRKIDINRDRTRYELHKTVDSIDPDKRYYSMYPATQVQSRRHNASGHRIHREDNQNILTKGYLKHLSLTPHPIRVNSNPAQYVPLDVQDLLKELQLYDLTRPLTHTKTGPNNNNVPRRTSTTESNQPGLNWIQTNNNKIPLPPGFLPTIPPNDEIPFVVNNDFDSVKNQLHNIPTDTPMEDPQQILDILLKKKMLSVVTLESDSPTSVKMMFGLPTDLVGMRGSVDLRYTDSDDKNVSNWESQVFAPADEILGTSRLEFRLPGLKPSTVYHIQAKLFLHGRSEQPVSSVYTVKTLDEPVVEEMRIQVDSGLSVTELNATNALLSWRRFNRDELPHIDALQIRYRPVEQAIYSTTELLHSSRMSVQLHSLKPNTKYEAALILVPPVGGQMELVDPRSVPFFTPPLIDIYDWPVTVETDEIGSNTVSLKWKGIPSPPEKFVSVYRAVHACEGSTAATSDEDNHVFKLAVRDHKPTIFITGLQPGTRCRLWIELFLTNGKKRMSNVLDILTKPADSNEDIDNIVEASGVAATGRRSDYYGPLVVVAVLAALATMSALLLLLVLLRRHRPHSVPITTTVPSAPRALPSLPPYDNPSYKLELQQETMNL